MSSATPTCVDRHPWQIAIVEAFTKTDTAMEVRFIGGQQATFPLDTHHRRLERQCLSGSALSRLPFAFLFREGKIVDIGVVSSDWIVAVNEQSQYPQYAAVEFGGMNSPELLDKHHPRYERILRQLEHARDAELPVWCIMQGSTIADVLDPTSEEGQAITNLFSHYSPRAM